MPNTATVESSSPKVPPTLGAGRVTPEVLHQWERACKEYFRVKGVAQKKKVESVLSRLQDLHIADWAEANEAALVQLDFPEFMEKLRGQALEKDWDRKIKLAMLASKQGDRPFHEWAYEMQTRNALLRGRPYHCEDGALHETLENNMDQGLELRIRWLAIEPTVPLRDWIETVKAEDEFVSRERKEAKEMAKEMYRMERAEHRVERTGMKNITNSGRSGGTDSNFGRSIGTRAIINLSGRPAGDTVPSGKRGNPYDPE